MLPQRHPRASRHGVPRVDLLHRVGPVREQDQHLRHGLVLLQLGSAFRVVRRPVRVPDRVPRRVQHPPPPGHPQMGQRPFIGQAGVADARQRLGEPGVLRRERARRDHPDLRAPLVGAAPAAPVVVAPQRLQQGGGIAVVGDSPGGLLREELLHRPHPLRALGMALGVGVDVGREVLVLGGVEGEAKARLVGRGGVHQPVFEASAPLLRLDVLIRSPQGEPAPVDPAVVLPALLLPVRDLDAARPGDDADLELQVRAQALDVGDHLLGHGHRLVDPSRPLPRGYAGLLHLAVHAARHVDGEHELHLVRDALDPARSGGLLRQGGSAHAPRAQQGRHDVPPGEGGREIDLYGLRVRVGRHAYVQALQRLAPGVRRQVQQVEPGVALGLPAQHRRVHAHALRAHLLGRREPGRSRRIFHPPVVRLQVDVRHRQRGGADQHGGHQDAGHPDRPAGVAPQPRQRADGPGVSPALPGHLDSRLRGNDGAEVAGTTKAGGTPASRREAPFPEEALGFHLGPAQIHAGGSVHGFLTLHSERYARIDEPWCMQCGVHGIHDVTSDGSGVGACGRPFGAAGGRVAGELKGMALAW